MKKRVSFYLLLTVMTALTVFAACGGRTGESGTTETAAVSEDSDTGTDTAAMTTGPAGTEEWDLDLIARSTSDKHDITVDFGTVEGTPIFKKLDEMISGWIGGDTLKKCSGKVADMRVNNLRFDLSPNSYGLGDEGGNYLSINRMIESYTENGVLPYIAYFNMPLYLAGAKGTEAAPADLSGWKKFCRDFAEDLRTHGLVAAGHEMWNEPDMEWAWKSSAEDYIELYRYGTAGILEGNPDAVVGGLSAGTLDTSLDFARTFLKAVNEEKLPIDFLSYHAYNKVSDGYGQDPIGFTKLMLSLMEPYDMPTVRLHLTEYNISQGEETLSYAGAAKALEQIRRCNEKTDIELVSMAAFYDPNNKLCAVNTRLQPLSMYYAIQFYNNMPFMQNRVENGTKVDCFASSDGHRACAVLYNLSGMARDFDLKLDRLPFNKGTVSVYIINKQYSTYDSRYVDFHLGYRESFDGASDLSFTVHIGRCDSYYICIEDDSGINEAAKAEDAALIGDFVRKDYYYTQRDKNCFAEYDRLSQTLVMGMGDNTDTMSETSVVLDNAADAIRFETRLFGSDAKGECGMQIAYHTADGYTKAVYYPIAGAGSPDFFWSSTTEKGEKLSGIRTVDIRGEAPAGFDGRIRISFLIEGMEKGTSALVRMYK